MFTFTGNPLYKVGKSKRIVNLYTSHTIT